MKKKRFVFGAGLGIILAIVCSMAVMGVFDGDTEAVHINGNEIENGTLIIGTHMIHISAMNDQIYNIAQESASQSGQSNIYYKSELSGGGWHEISSASGLSDITQGEKVGVDVINQLFLRYHTKSDGITYDLMKGASLCIFNITDPYSLDTLPELDAIVIQHSLLTGKEEGTDTDKDNIKEIETLINGDMKKLFDEKGILSQEEIDKREEQLDTFQQYYEQNTGNSKGQTVLMLMESLDGARRLEIYQYLYDVLLPELLEKVQSPPSGNYVDYDLVDAIGTSLEEVEKKLLKLEASVEEEGTTSISKEKYKQLQELSDALESGDTESADKLASYIQAITDIENGSSGNTQGQGEVLKEALLPAAIEALKSCLDGNGDGEENIETSLWELDYLINTAVSVLSASEAEELLQSVLGQLENLKTDEDGTNKLLESSIGDLKKTIASLNQSEASGLSELITEKKQLQNERLKAMDQNDLNTAADLQLQIDGIDEKIRQEEKRLTDIISSDEASEEDKLKAEEMLGTETVSGLMEELKNDVLDNIDKESYEEAQTGIEGIESMADSNPSMAASCLKDIYKNVVAEIYLNGTDSQLQSLKDNLQNLMVNIDGALNSEIDSDSIMSLLAAAAGEDFDSASEKQKIIMAAALYNYATQMGNANAAAKAAGLASAMYSAGNPYVYQRLGNEAEKFIPLKNFAECSGHYRYVFYNSSKSVTLRNGTEYYIYTVFSREVKTNNDETEEMETYARYQEDIYISEKYMEDVFETTCIYIKDTSYGIIVTADMEDDILEIMDKFISEVSQ